jgi:hypothetical protein
MDLRTARDAFVADLMNAVDCQGNVRSPGDERSSWSYQGKGGEDGGVLRLLKALGVG